MIDERLRRGEGERREEWFWSHDRKPSVSHRGLCFCDIRKMQYRVDRIERCERKRGLNRIGLVR